jgi:carbon monoxide dehydrogenase subunit G
MRYEETTVVDAPIEQVWRLTTDIQDWAAFLPTVQRLERLDTGELRVGSSARIKQPRQSTAVWTVTCIDPAREFSWETSRMGVRMIGRHLLEATGAGTRMTLVLETSGAGAGLLTALFGGMMRSSLRRETESFARHAVTSR